MPTISTDDAITELGGTKCHGCDGAKERAKSHCRTCYFNLPKKLRGELYNRVGAGYEEAYTESLNVLRARNGLPARVIA